MSDDSKSKQLATFEGKKIRRYWDEKSEKWYFSVVDVAAALTDSQNPAVYWRVLKKRLIDEGAGQTVTNCNGLKMPAADGKMRITDMAGTESMFRIIQSIPSPKAEPFKLWLARAAYERVEETSDPELAIHRGLKYYLNKGYTKDWINQRLKSIEIRKALTDEWEKRNIKEGDEYASLTDIITQAWAGMTTKHYKKFKKRKKENLRDNMTNLELVLNMLAETATTKISQKRKPDGFIQSSRIAKEGGTIAGNARKEIEQKTSEKVVTSQNYLGLKKRKKLRG